MITNEVPPQACLADFRLSAFTPGIEGATNTITASGTPLYMAPELLAPTKPGSASFRPTKPADIYALGMVMFEVLSGCQPFDERKWTTSEILVHAVSGEQPAKPDNAEQAGFGHGIWELVKECWRQEPTGRPTIDQVLLHLTRVAASLTVVDQTPEVLCENHQESGSPREYPMPLVHSNCHPDAEGATHCFFHSNYN